MWYLFTTGMFILDYVIYRIVAVILEMFWDKTVLVSRLYNTRGYINSIFSTFIKIAICNNNHS
jgi:hypothetical protein